MNPTSPAYNTDHFIKDPIDANGPLPVYAQIFLGDGNPPVTAVCSVHTACRRHRRIEIAQDTCGGPANPDGFGERGPGPDHCRSSSRCRRSRRRKSISVAAARQVFGGGGGVPPWEDRRLPVSSAGGNRDAPAGRQADRAHAKPVLGNRPGQRGGHGERTWGSSVAERRERGAGDHRHRLLRSDGESKASRRWAARPPANPARTCRIPA